LDRAGVDDARDSHGRGDVGSTSIECLRLLYAPINDNTTLLQTQTG
jgi:hypothetical protein